MSKVFTSVYVLLSVTDCSNLSAIQASWNLHLLLFGGCFLGTNPEKKEADSSLRGRRAAIESSQIWGEILLSLFQDEKLSEARRDDKELSTSGSVTLACLNNVYYNLVTVPVHLKGVGPGRGQDSRTGVRPVKLGKLFLHQSGFVHAAIGSTVYVLLLQCWVVLDPF